MADGNPNSNSNQNPNQKNDNQQKPGLSWTQPGQNNNSQNKNANTTSPKPITTATSTLSNTPADSTGRVISIIIGIVVVFALAAWGIVALHNRSNSDAAVGTDTATSTSASTTDTTTTGTKPASDAGSAASTNNTPATAAAGVATGATASLSVASPQDAGSSVKVTGMSLSAPTWIIVYETAGGKPTRILGATLFFKGDTAGTVSLLRNTASGQDYLVSAAVDNGDKAFSLSDDKVVPDSTGAQMWIKFSTH